jgi:hypothetical protein
MPDISMCADDECPSRAKCYRSKASGTVPSEYQQAFTDFEREPEDERCGDFWPNVTGRAALDELAKAQEPLGAEFEDALWANKEGLYEP